MKKKEVSTPTNETAKTQSKGVRIALLIGNILINTLIVAVLIVSILIATLALTSKANNGVPSVFGYSFHTIMSPSMVGGNDLYGGGDYNVGDLVIGKTTNGDTNEVYEVGDIVVYTTQKDNTPDGVEMIVHRVVKRVDRGNGLYEYTTKGDNNSLEDEKTHTAADIVAVCYRSDYDGKVLRGFGDVLNFLRSSKGFFLVVLLPMIIFFLYAIVRVVLNALNYRKSKDEESKEDAEREKQAAVEAAVKAALEAAGKTDDADAVKDEAEAADESPAAESEAPAEKAAELTPEQMEQFKQFLAFQKAQEAKGDDSAEPQDGEPEE